MSRSAAADSHETPLRNRYVRGVADLDVFPERASLELAEHSRQTRMPTKGRWKEIQKLGAEIATMHGKQGEVGAELGRLHQRLNAADAHDAQALADWHEAGAKGERPSSSRPVIEEQRRGRSSRGARGC